MASVVMWDWSAIEAVATAGILITSVAAAVYARSQLINFMQNERLKRAMDLSRGYFSKQGDDPSPDTCYTRLLNLQQRGIDAAFEDETPQQQLDAQRLWTITLHNFYDEALDLLNRKLIDEEYFLNRFQNLIPAADKVLKGGYQYLAAVGEISPGPTVISTLSARVRDWRAHSARNR